MEGVKADIIVLAGYMLVVGEEICEIHDMINSTGSAQWPGRHLAGGDLAADTQRAQESGNMMHLVTKELDKGPPITYCTFPSAVGV